MARIAFEQMDKRYPGAEGLAVDDLNLEINDGEFLVLVGPSGCGKTTALRCLAGLEDISGGQIIIGDRVVNDLPPKSRDIAMVFQSYALYPHMTVFENMAFSIRMRKRPKPEIDTKVREAAQILGLENLLDRKPGALSGGQRQRVALGRAIVRDPAAFLMDEPLSNLDAKLRVQTRAEIARLHQRLGTTIVYVTHDQVEAMTMGDRIAVMRDGVLQQVGTPKMLYEAPANRFVAGFIGSPAMNFLTGRVRTDGDRVSLALDGLDMPLSGRAAATARTRGNDSELVVGMRPEHFDAADSATDGTISVPATVEVVEFLGNEELIHANVAGNDVVALVPASRGMAVGDNVTLVISDSVVHAFDPTNDAVITVGEGRASPARVSGLTPN
ncbi:MAG: sn-glycerol-3-phosphate ABC transporter ATP-binding protein UgpC [Candidatus Dormibacteraeota bacterium]|uniref:Glycerol-3-phosphate ABC transporter ATP-binding protein n=1 Tax=Candidatus Aeolococcus gillhamiae TaxID=3127015 RepID=A0A2W5Z6P1_9BACT|nr:sn-glycerol-3-phosphate ABC transporter ATP-binding protein UgpC [Candidatus Dormibacteraeota bacterium]PZR78416.1 MAG: glycerol-3-phosphate ABC transporter ATP-binding protein [Candidatus Dormibacter sp. RRmetagenome_bin12]